MIPLKLQLKNFLSYGPELQTIDFTAYPLICLTGKNGHGKSALLDAITWALWGQARKPFGIAKPDQALLHLGQAQMLVVFDFVFNDQTYRVRREFVKSYGKMTASLDFGVVDTNTNSYNALTDKTIKATQDKIERMLNLDMESFVNSAFLRQGQANEFSKKSAKDRKTVLATILGLNRYELLRVRAHEKIKEATSDKQLCLALQEKRSIELALTEKVAEELEVITKQIQDLEHQEQQLITAQTHLVITQKQIAEQQKRRAVTYHEHDQCGKQQELLLASLHQTIQGWKTTHKQLLKLPDKQTLENNKQQIVHEISSYQQCLAKSLEIKGTLLTAQQAAHQRLVTLQNTRNAALHAKELQTNQLALEQTHLEKQITEQALHIATDTQQIDRLKIDSANLNKTVSDYATNKEYNDLQEKQFDKRRAYYQIFVAHGNETKQKLTELIQKKKLVHDENNPSCPLCEQNLSASRKRFLHDTFARSEQFLMHRFNRLSSIIAHLKNLLIAQHEEIKTIREQQKLYEQQTIQSQEIKKQIQTLVTALTNKKETLKDSELLLQTKATHRAHAQAEYNVLVATEQNNLHNDPELVEYTKKIATLEKEYTTVSYDKEKHLHAQQQLQTIEESLAMCADTNTIQTTQIQRSHTIKSICESIKIIKQQLKESTKTLQLFINLEAEIVSHAAQEHAVNTQQKEILTTKQTFFQKKGSLENQLLQLNNLEKEFTKTQKNITELTAFIDDYHLIATATGKNGIQALLIEQAIPEIEQEANLLLGRLTNNQAHIIIESLRDLKNGSTKETLDIKISDTIGIRPYELFSGGEAFRIDFALRIAISKLLARRAGTSLQTLIIDEGFGSQDEDGLSNIMDALYKIQDDFSKIIIVSHLPTMKDQFPVHFLIEKNAQGSHVRIMEQG